MRRFYSISAFAMAAGVAGCASGPGATLSAESLASSCSALNGHRIEASRIALPTSGARIESATLVRRTETLPEHCRLLGEIAPVDPKAPAIRFQLNLPATWNGKTLQYGGGGFNGVLITGLAPLRDAPHGMPAPLEQGYATFGTDSGHQSGAYPPLEVAAWALNDEARTNFGYASYKKVKDVAHALVADFYAGKPTASYFFGGSEGGREGITMAQRFPADYDGIVSVVPVINYVGLNHSFLRAQLAQVNKEAWLGPPQIKALSEGVTRACDALDGLEDGIVHNYFACLARFDPALLRCPAGGPGCLSDAQVDVVRRMYSPYRLIEPMANGIVEYPSRMPGGEGVHNGGWDAWVAGKAPPTLPANANASRQWLYGGNFIRYFIARDPKLDLAAYDPARYRTQLQEASRLMDSTDPDLSAFFARGGKLIVRENASDLAQSAQAGMDYYRAVVARFGQAKADEHLRLYVSPASTHSGNAISTKDGAEVPTSVDLLGVLDRWVARGEAPADALTQVLDAKTAPHAILASRPMCRYPNYPHYVGGDRLKAESYACRESRP
jgi:hypothetical protein